MSLTPPDTEALTYDWSGLRSRRILLVVAVMSVFPGSCVAAAITDSGLSILLPLLLLALSLTLIRRWPCPRCDHGFSARSRFPWIAPLATRCRTCGLPDFTPSSDLAPAAASLEETAARPELTPEQAERARLRSRRMRVALVFAIPLVYLSMCRLPDGAPMQTPEGHTVHVLGLSHLTTNQGGRSSHGVVLTYYLPDSAEAVTTDELLALTLPAVRQTGDSNVRLQAMRGDWWARGLGIRVSYTNSYYLMADGTWHRD